MLFSACDTAPKAGEYLVYGADNILIGVMVMKEGGILPPGISGLDYFELTQNAMQ